MDSLQKTNTQKLYKTVDHTHLDSLIMWATGDYPSSGIVLAECQDGRWFVEVDYGDEFNHLPGISKPLLLPYEEPRFFSSEERARSFACECIHSVHPELEGRNLTEYFTEE